MSPQTPSAHLVDPYSDPVIIKLQGRASLYNSGAVRDFLGEMLSEGKRNFVIDFSDCTGIDSTFLGVIAGCALDLRRSSPRGSLVLCRLGARNLELIHNLGLHRIATVDNGHHLPSGSPGRTTALNSKVLSEVENARLCLEAHEKLVTADASNKGKFQDVIAFLKNRVEQR
ncbi:MAG: anti-sigma factor antagonist [Puniceicoccaceae bacterium]|nr:MAG: anti-sigma factor antagonist [Puniceicoccaceae bacterium]